jgi:hypothetical protein
VSGYIEAGYLAVLVGLGSYGSSLLWRERLARRRLPPEDAAERQAGGEDR